MSKVHISELEVQGFHSLDRLTICYCENKLFPVPQNHLLFCLHTEFNGKILLPLSVLFASHLFLYEDFIMFRVSQPMSVNKQAMITDSLCDNMLRRRESRVGYTEA